MRQWVASEGNDRGKGRDGRGRGRNRRGRAGTEREVWTEKEEAGKEEGV